MSAFQDEFDKLLIDAKAAEDQASVRLENKTISEEDWRIIRRINRYAQESVKPIVIGLVAEVRAAQKAEDEAQAKQTLAAAIENYKALHSMDVAQQNKEAAPVVSKGNTFEYDHTTYVITLQSHYISMQEMTSDGCVSEKKFTQNELNKDFNISFRGQMTKTMSGTKIAKIANILYCSLTHSVVHGTNGHTGYKPYTMISRAIRGALENAKHGLAVDANPCD